MQWKMFLALSALAAPPPTIIHSLKNLNLKKGSFVVFDKAYNDYQQYFEWTNEDIYFVTRQKENAAYKSVEEFDLEDSTPGSIFKDEVITVQKKIWS